jgi:hypothetical protein
MSGVLIYDNRKEITNENEKYLQRYGTMYKELKQTEKWYHLLYYPIFLARRLVFVGLLVLLPGYQEIQMNIFILSTFLVSKI